VVLNYANPDMVGHTGNYEATIRALETVDRCLGRLLAAVVDAGGTTLILADHGNAELMWDENGKPLDGPHHQPRSLHFGGGGKAQNPRLWRRCQVALQRHFG
jgi:bisphosphoglycerate-independent phosphoglycerate mutase (AlkP superfamily)